MKMEQLIGMGFSEEDAMEALGATGGESTMEAVEWIVSHKQSDEETPLSLHPPPPIPTASRIKSDSSPFQPKLDRFFRFHSKPNDSPRKSDDDEITPPIKRPKLISPSSQQPCTKTPVRRSQPLSDRMRPLTIDEVVGQDHLLSTNSLIRSAIHCNRLPSLIFWGPPGTGKTSIAKSVVHSSFYRFVSLSAVTCGVKDIRDAVEDARKIRVLSNKTTVLFFDEVHRFNKSQLDSFLPVIEDGSIVFMGATTENPSFHLTTPLLSRCRLVTLKPLQPHHVKTLLERAVEDKERGLCKSVEKSIKVNEDAIMFLATNCDGDARVALNALEISATTAATRIELNDKDVSVSSCVTLDDAKEALQCKHLAYDKDGEEHYNLISALHKSMRGSDANASIYWLARMLEGGDEPLYIARRMIRFASEDVGLADPLALNQAVACYQACHFLGMPECNVILAQCAAYLALAPKSIAVYRAIGDAQKVVKESVGQNEGVPLHLRNAPTKLMKELGYAKNYIYPPDNPNASTQTYLPPSLQGYNFLDWPNSNSTHQ